jgi:alkanesulfonate monooxygenase SsuD/methylene tetrahydromethanopterin reductase-like flavin-dependent oxidoreductase (luciferase family)
MGREVAGVELSVQIETFNLTWDRWRRIVADVERLGYAGLYVCDHFATPEPIAHLEVVSLDAWTALAYLAAHSRRLRFGPLVSPVSFRDPVVLARQARDLDDLSGGRFVLGVGAGWVEREHRMFGWPLGDAKARVDRLAEALEVITRLTRSPEPVDFAGRFYTLRDARLRPAPTRPSGPALLLGSSGGARSLALAARYADVFNTPRRSPARIAEVYRELDARLAARGRDPATVTRTLMASVFVWRDDAERDRRLRFGLTHLNPQRLGPTDFAAARRANGDLVGTPAEVVEQLHAWGTRGVQEVMMDVYLLGDEDLDLLEVVAAEVLPHL